MADSLRLKVLTPAGLAVETEASEVVIPGVEGEFGVLPSHTPYLAMVVSGLVSYTVGGRREEVAVRGGLAEVNENRVVILTEEARRPGDLEAAEAETRETEARRRLDEALALGQEAESLMEDLSFQVGLRKISASSGQHPR